MHYKAAAVAVFALVTAAGVPLLGGDSAPATGNTGTAPAGHAESTEDAQVLPWDYYDCQYVLASIPTPRTRVEPYLPTGFQASHLGAATTGPTPEALSLVGIEIDVCPRALSSTGEVEHVVHANFWTSTIPPPEYTSPGVSLYFIVWDYIDFDPVRRAALAELGVPARSGNVTITTQAEPLNGILDAPYTVDGLGTFRIEATTLENGGGNAATPLRHWVEGDNGTLAQWDMNYTTTQSFTGTGSVHLDPASWLADMFGKTEVRGVVYTGTWSYTDGRVTFPV